jgi:hypothetical protein
MTNEGTLRHPSYQGLRGDKKAEAVVLEPEAPVAEIAEPATSKVKISTRDRVIFPGPSITPSRRPSTAKARSSTAKILDEGSHRSQSRSGGRIDRLVQDPFKRFTELLQPKRFHLPSWETNEK